MQKINLKSLLFFVLFGLLITVLCQCKDEKDDDIDKPDITDSLDIPDSLDILDKLKMLPGVTVTEIASQTGAPREFQLDISQLLDHNNPNGPTFTQRAYLSHYDEKMPMIFAPNGYQSSARSIQELAVILETNCLNVSHRYFLDSRPNPTNWKYLTIKQAADDHHKIVSLLKNIYKGKWISSGASKSGLTPLFHKRYYPNDVDATVAYVAPFTFGAKDSRYPVYLKNIGSSECFEKLKMVQFYALKHRSEFLTLLDNYIQSDAGNTYPMDKELILELNIMDYPFVFWQYYKYSCSSIPDTTSTSPEALFSHINSIVSFSSYSNSNISYYEPYCYQALTELGQIEYENYYDGLLKKVDLNTTGNPNVEAVAPKGITYNYFNSATVPEIYSWLQDHGDHIIYIYGKNDPWSAGAIELTGSADAVCFMIDGENHGARISRLSDPSVVYNKLEEWLGITITPVKSAVQTNYNDDEGFRLHKP